MFEDFIPTLQGMTSFAELFTGTRLLGLSHRIGQRRQYIERSIEHPSKRQRTGDASLSWRGRWQVVVLDLDDDLKLQFGLFIK